MTKSQIAVRIPPSLHAQLNNYVKQTGSSKTEVVVSVIAQYIGCAEIVPLMQRVAELESQVAELRALVKK
ncbi:MULTISPECIES: hypothetical protein [Aerosakkonema]|uniref:hypothetical protein n=1 Tax=Aerosakkonema TaxID=1246629 RepID=UPI0035B9F05B